MRSTFCNSVQDRLSDVPFHLTRNAYWAAAKINENKLGGFLAAAATGAAIGTCPIILAGLPLLGFFSPEFVSTDQNTLNSNLAQFLKLIEGKEMEAMGEKFKKGQCYSLSLCYSAKNAEGNLADWEAMLTAVGSWNGKIDELSKPIKLATRTDSLSNIFYEVLKDVAFHQYQNTKFVPTKNYFNRLKYYKTAQATGNFSSEQLIKLLDEKQAQNSLCLVTNINHAICIGYKNNKWFVYDPNYMGLKNKSLTRNFDTKHECANEIIKILGNTVSIRMSQQESKEYKQQDVLTKEYEKLLQTNISGIADNNGLFLISQNQTEILPQVFITLREEKNSVQSIFKCLSTVPAGSLTGNTGLHSMIFDNPECLAAILNLAAETKEESVLKHIADALLIKDKEQTSGLYMLASHSPELLSKAIDLLAKKKEGAEYLAKILSSKHHSDWTGLHLIARYAPKSLSAALDCAIQSKEGVRNIKEALDSSIIPSPDSPTRGYALTGYGFIEWYAPQAATAAARAVAQIVGQMPTSRGFSAR